MAALCHTNEVFLWIGLGSPSQNQPLPWLPTGWFYRYLWVYSRLLQFCWRFLLALLLLPVLICMMSSGALHVLPYYLLVCCRNSLMLFSSLLPLNTAVRRALPKSHCSVCLRVTPSVQGRDLCYLTFFNLKLQDFLGQELKISSVNVLLR